MFWTDGGAGAPDEAADREARRRRWPLDAAACVAALLYAAFGVAWILWSDRLLFGLSSDPGVLRSMGEWKGLFFVVLSAIWVGAAGWRFRPAASSGLADDNRRLLVVLGLATIVVVGIGVSGAIRSARGERQLASEMLAVVVRTRAAHWAAWVDERVHDAQSRAVEAQQLLSDLRRDPDATGRLVLAARLRTLCDQLGCQAARIDALPDGAEVPINWTVLGGDGAGSPRQLRLEVYAPLGGLPGQVAQALVLRFDATAALARLLDNGGVDLDGMRVLLSRRVEGRWEWLEAGSASELKGWSFAGDALESWPDLGATRAPQPRSFDARVSAEQNVAGAAAPAPGGWTLATMVDAQRLYRRAWGDLLWIVAADVAAVVLAVVAVYALQQRRQLLALRRERAEHEARLRALDLVDAISSSSPDLIFTKDLQGRFTFVNRATCEALGQTQEALLGGSAAHFLGGPDWAWLAALGAEVLRSEGVVSSEGELTLAQGRRWCLGTMGPLREPDGRISGLFGVVHDLTERRSHEERNRQWAKAFESTRDGVVICDAKGLIQTVNLAFTEITGYAADEVVGQSPALLKSGRQDPSFYRELWANLVAWGHWQGEIWNRRKDGEVYPEWLTISAVKSDDGAVTNYVGVFTDITRVKHDEAKLQRLANYDPLTELPNRRLLNARLEQALADTRRYGGRTALFYVDLDGFKTVNDSLGHPAGDELLVCMAQRFKERVRQGDTLGRLGGDEFLLIAESMEGPEAAAALAQDLLNAVARPVSLGGGHQVYVTASIGISLFPDDGCTDATAMMRDADAALYRAKELGRNRFHFYTQELNLQAVAKLELEVALSQALDRGELLLHYQPKVCAASGRIVGAEALLRWHRGGEIIPPGRFIPVAEQSSLILDIGAWVIDEVCAQHRRWREQGLDMPQVAVNVAARQFAAGNLDLVLKEALHRHGVPPACLELEVTESMLIDRPAEGIEMLHRLKDIGVTLSLDDFGTGYSSLAYLRQFPIDALKIDKSFVDHIEDGPDGGAIVDAVIALAHRLQLDVVAEGVETAGQQDYLCRQRCDVLQGFGLARPMPAADFEALCARQATPEPSSQA